MENKDYLEFEIKTYEAKAYAKYLRKSQIDDDDINEIDELVRRAARGDDGEPTPPPVIPARIAIFDSDIFDFAIEASSLEAMQNNPEQPENDITDLYFTSGAVFAVVGSYDEVVDKIVKFKSKKSKK